MEADLSPIFRRYESLAAQADALFQKVSRDNPGCVKCGPGCDDCCHALFDLSLVEAMYLNAAFTAAFKYGPERSRMLENASKIDRELTRLKRGMFRAEKDGAKPDEILAQAASLRMRCPLLDDAGKCSLYEARPITCRLYGIPLNIGGKSHVCGLSAFERGKTYPAVHMAAIQAKLEELGREIGRAVGSKFELSDVYVPISMALLTKYDDSWFGIGKNGEDD